MRTYTVHHRLNGARDLMHEVEGLVFVKEGFCWPALFVPGLWMLFRGLWLVLVAYLATVMVVVVGAAYAGLSEDATFLLNLAVNLIAGFEGNNLRRWTLRRRGLSLVGLVTGRRAPDAERRFIEQLVDGSYRPIADARPAVRPASPPRAGTWARPDTEDDVVGLFPSPDKTR